MLKQLWENIRCRYRLMKKEDKAGLYITVIVHLTVIIVLLIIQIHTEISRENVFMMDFSRVEEQEKLLEEKLKEEQLKESISKRLDELIGKMPARPAEPEEEIRNIAVDAGAALKDDRNTDAENLYKDAERLANELKSGSDDIMEDARDEAVDLNTEDEPEKENDRKYSGPSVLSYTLDGRKASHLRIPAYKCFRGGEVTVIITVDPSGRVMNAKVLDDVSSLDQCLRDFAVKAARMSWFSSSRTAPPRQTGEIVYRFIAQ